MPNFAIVALNSAVLRPPESPKMVILGKNLPLGRGKFWGLIAKVEYRCTTTNLPLCNDTLIVVLTITLLNSVSVITNFVIRKRDKQIFKKLEINMQHLRGAMQYWQAP